MSSRTEKLLRMVVNNSNKELQDRLLDLPFYESTKSTSDYERYKAIVGWKELEIVNLKNLLLSKKLESTTINQTNYIYNNYSDIESEPFQSSGSEYEPSDNGSDLDNDNNKSQKVGTSNEITELKKTKKTLESKASIEEASTSTNSSSNITKKSKKCLKKHFQTKAISKSNCNPVTDKITLNSDRSSSESEGGININSAKKKNGKRIRDKGHACYFCHKQIINVAKHFEVMHQNESAVAKILAMPKNSSQRKQAFGHLIRAGDFYHNCEVLTTKKGELILVRRPAEIEIKFVNYSDYGPCPDCLGFMLKKHLWHHVKHNCAMKTNLNDEEDKDKRYPSAESTALLNGIFGSEFSSDYTNNIIGKLRNDDVGQICRNDKLILKFGAFLYEKYNTTQNELIRQYMRQIGRLLIELKKLGNITDLSSCLIPKNFDMIVQATKNVCVSQNEISKRPEFKVPSLALKIGYALKKCIGIERGIALREENFKRNESLSSFLNLMELEWSVRISSNALATLYKRKFNATQLLPLTSDLVKLSQFLENEMITIKKEINNNFTTNLWNRLVAATLSRIILFNKRRSGEAAKIKLETYAMRPSWSEQGTEELKNSLSKFELDLASKLIIVETEGKRGKKVPVLLTREMKSCVDLIIKTRSDAGVEPNNPYIFARLNNSLSHVRGHDCLRKFCSEVELQCPSFITGTKLRKYVATVCQVFNLSENETDWLAKHLGHDVRVHREFYRLHESAVELTKVSRLLLAVDKGEANQFAGKKLEDINISDLPRYEEEIENLDSEDDLEKEDSTAIENTQITETETTVDDVEELLEVKESTRTSAKKTKRTAIKKSWTSKESEAVLTYFNQAIKNERVPRKEECENCIKKNQKVLSARKWTDIKFHVKNYIIKIKKMNKK